MPFLLLLVVVLLRSCLVLLLGLATEKLVLNDTNIFRDLVSSSCFISTVCPLSRTWKRYCSRISSYLAAPLLLTSMAMKRFLSVALYIILPVIILLFPRSHSFETIHETHDEKRTTVKQPVPQHLEEICVLVTDAASGVGRAIALELSDLGVHVLAGVKTEAEKRSFLFASRKGLETIIFDVSDPALVASTIYRIQQLQSEWNRRFFGVILNLSDTMNEWKTNMKHEEELVDVDAFDTSYRMIVRSSIRLLQGNCIYFIGWSIWTHFSSFSLTNPV